MLELREFTFKGQIDAICYIEIEQGFEKGAKRYTDTAHVGSRYAARAGQSSVVSDELQNVYGKPPFAVFIENGELVGGKVRRIPVALYSAQPLRMEKVAATPPGGLSDLTPIPWRGNDFERQGSWQNWFKLPSS